MGDVTRKTFLKKIYAEDNKSWVQVRRTKEMTFETGTGASYQATTYVFEWPEDEDDDNGRERTKKILHKNDADDGDPSNEIALWVTDKVSVRGFVGDGRPFGMQDGVQTRGQETKFVFDNTDQNELRKLAAYNDESRKSLTVPDELDGGDVQDGDNSDGSSHDSIVVEVIKQFTGEKGQGYHYLKTLWDIDTRWAEMKEFPGDE